MAGPLWGSRGGWRLERPARGALIALLVLNTAMARAADPGTRSPRLEAVLVDQEPAIDGRLDDACWQTATHVAGFHRMDREGPELEHTEVWLCCDAGHIYVAYYCHDSVPGEIQALQRKRGGDVSKDDAATISLDVNCDHRTAYAFGVTPRGTQVETIPGGSAEKYEWRGDWTAGARVTEDGWTAELAIPFSILRYPQGQTTFGVHFRRYLARMTDWSCWPDLGRTEDLTRDAQWAGVATPKHHEPVILMPYSVSGFGEGERELLSSGLDSRYTLPNGLVTMFSYQPDFRNIEDVVESIDFTYTERQLPEHRPFFTEGGGEMTEWGEMAGSYYPPTTLFYSRRIATLDAGAKAFGELGRDRLGLLAAWEQGTARDWVLAYGHGLGDRGLVQVGAVDHREQEGLDNQALHLGAHWDWPLSDGGAYAGVDRYQGRTEGPGGDGQALSLDLGRYRPNGLGWAVSWTQIDDDFQNVVQEEEWGSWRRPVGIGFVPETGVRGGVVSVARSQTRDTGPLEQTGWDLYANRYDDLAGGRWDMGGGYRWGWRNDTSWGWAIGRGERAGYPQRVAVVSRDWHNKDVYSAGSAEGRVGEFLGGPYRFLRLSQAHRVTQDLCWQIRLEQVRLSAENPDDTLKGMQALLTATYDLSDERSVSARLVYRRGNASFWLPQVDYDPARLPTELQDASSEQEAARLNVYAVYRQRVAHGRDILVILGNPNTPGTEARIAVKVVWTHLAGPS